MTPDITYEGDFSCRLANVQADDDDALAAATELMNQQSGVSAVRIEHFLSKENIEAIIDATRRISLKRMEGMSFDNELYTLGVPQSVGRVDKSVYFQRADAWREDAVFMEAIGPDSEVVKRTIHTFESAFGMPLEPAQEEGRPLLPATLRCIDFADVHKDLVSAQTNWDISKLRNDIAWNIYLRMPRNGGELVLYPPEAARLLKICDIERFTPINVQCAPGDLIFFRSVIPHGVRRADQPDTRLTVSGCLGFEPPPAERGMYWA